MKTKDSNFINKLLGLGFVPASSDGFDGEVYENYINNHSVEVILFNNGEIGIEIYDEEDEEEISASYHSSAPIIRLINKIMK